MIATAARNPSPSITTSESTRTEKGRLTLSDETLEYLLLFGQTICGNSPTNSATVTMADLARR
jgi:hypothetical protein